MADDPLPPRSRRSFRLGVAGMIFFQFLWWIWDGHRSEVSEVALRGDIEDIGGGGGKGGLGGGKRQRIVKGDTREGPSRLDLLEQQITSLHNSQAQLTAMITAQTKLITTLTDALQHAQSQPLPDPNPNPTPQFGEDGDGERVMTLRFEPTPEPTSMNDLQAFKHKFRRNHYDEYLDLHNKWLEETKGKNTIESDRNRFASAYKRITLKDCPESILDQITATWKGRKPSMKSIEDDIKNENYSAEEIRNIGFDSFGNIIPHESYYAREKREEEEAYEGFDEYERKFDEAGMSEDGLGDLPKPVQKFADMCTRLEEEGMLDEARLRMKGRRINVMNATQSWRPIPTLSPSSRPPQDLSKIWDKVDHTSHRQRRAGRKKI
ncbi:hypothetical protein AAMO2058_001305400 [Amorphochlora amoebiformis]